MEEIVSFNEALRLSAAQNRRHVFLGNGFSRACRNDIFAYDALFERADFAALTPHAQATFEALGTTDFEKVIEGLRTAAAIITAYGGDEELANTLLDDAEKLRDVLVSAIAGSHPNLLSEIEPNSYAACRRFLSNFERKFTVSYDLLLYWAVMQDEIEPVVNKDDGFRNPENREEDYVTWEIENNYSQNIYYLHGALHLFDSGPELQKYTWNRTGLRLTDQIRAALDQGKYPLFVAEGTSKEKMEKIKHSAYLTKAYDSFSGIGGALFMLGHSLAPNDEHFLKLIEKGKVTQLFVSIFGDQTSHENQAIIARANLIRQRRMERIARNRSKSRPQPLDVYFFDAQSAAPWG